jgi:hypothetical protein
LASATSALTLPRLRYLASGTAAAHLALVAAAILFLPAAEIFRAGFAVVAWLFACAQRFF